MNKNLLKNFKRILYHKARYSFMFIINKIFGTDENKIVFISFHGKSYSDNPKAISEKLYEMEPDKKIIWIFIKPEEKTNIIPRYVNSVKKNSIRELIELATAKYWVDNFPKKAYMYKSKNQIYVQTWHGDRGFKKILYDAWPHGKRPHPVIESEICDLAISGSEYSNRRYRTAFKYSGKILRVGCPRNDILVENNNIKIKSIKEKLHLDSDSHILMYAPTLRKHSASNPNYQNREDLDIKTVIQMLEYITSNKWLCITRAHSSDKGLKGISYDGDKVIDLSFYEDMNELLLITDFLITDYSSCAGDFALLNKPVILYQPDREIFEKNQRSFYFDLDKSPFIITRSQREVLDKIKTIKWDEMEMYCKNILKFYGTTETGEAAIKVINYLMDLD